MARLRCDSCELASINGLICHETVVVPITHELQSPAAAVAKAFPISNPRVIEVISREPLGERITDTPAGD